MEENYNKNQAMESLLVLYCQGMTTPEECKLVEEWIDRSEEHLRIAKQVYMIHRATSDMEILQEIQTEKALKKVNRLLSRNRWKIRFHRLEKVAAILFLPLLCAYLLQFFGKQDKVGRELLEVQTKSGRITQITLPDNTVVFLNTHSSLRYPQEFNGEKREVTLIGEGYFEVAHNDSSPFIVNLPQGVQIEVLGTTFNVEAYEDQPLVSTTLVEGHVNFLYNTKNGKKAVSMAPDHKVIYDKSTATVKYFQADSRTETSWKDGILIFNDTPISEVARQLGKHFNVSIAVNDKRLEEQSFTGIIDEQTLEPVLESFRIASKIQWRNAGTDTLTHKNELSYI